MNRTRPNSIMKNYTVSIALIRDEGVRDRAVPDSDAQTANGLGMNVELPMKHEQHYLTLVWMQSQGKHPISMA